MMDYSTITFILLIIISICLDLKSKKTNQCYVSLEYNDKIKLLNLLIIHHIVNIFANFGWLLNNKYILYLYIISPFFMLTYWSMNNNKCDLTLWANKICGWTGDKYFNDIFNIIGLKEIESWHKVYHKIFLALGVCIAIYKIKYIV